MAKKRKRFITKRRLKWAGAIASVMLATAMIASYWYWPSYVREQRWSSTIFIVGIKPGGAFVVRNEMSERLFVRFYQIPEYVSRAAQTRGPVNGETGVASPPLPIAWWPVVSSAPWPTDIAEYFYLPLWMPLVLLAAPTAYLWRTDRRAKPWQCAKCRYDLIGLEGGVCPECGAERKS